MSWPGVDSVARVPAVAGVARTPEDTPFYVRSVGRTRVLGSKVLGMPESLDLRRFTRPWVQALLSLRMPRMAG